MIRVREGTVLPKGDGHVLVYSSEGDCYYAVTLEDIFKRQDEKIEELRKENEELRTRFEEEVTKKIEDHVASTSKDVRVMKQIVANVVELVDKGE